MIGAGRQRAVVAGVIIAGSALAWGAAPPPALPATGAAIYLRGMLPDGVALQAARDQGPGVAGAAAACVNCHRPSGLGAVEGRSSVPPITGQFLFTPPGGARASGGLPFVASARNRHSAYTDVTLARAIRAGIDADGRPLSYLMPRYVIDDAALQDLSAYLRSLSPREVPGVTPTTLHFATIVTPDADVRGRDGMLAVLDHFFAEKNANTRAVAPPALYNRNMRFRAVRKWQLHVWTLTGPSDTWEDQLRHHLASEPVFAVISGIGGRTWAPIHRFCEQAALPCLFPNVQLPAVGETDLHTLYFSRGVLLEAQLLAARLQDPVSAGLRRVVQVYRADDIGAEAARALAAALQDAGVQVVERRLAGGRSTATSARALAGLGSGDGLVLWLRAGDLASLPQAPPPVAAVMLSGEMAGLERAPLPAAWRAAARMAYPVDLPDQRRVRVDFPLGWFRLTHVPLLDEPVQVDTYLACGILSETLNGMSDTFVRDYLIELIEAMLEHRVVTGYYPRLSLGPGQRFASKGGYLVRFVGDSGSRVAADGGWQVPP